jgi:DNA uptake protein ComE-like DNA-binding protein
MKVHLKRRRMDRFSPGPISGFCVGAGTSRGSVLIVVLWVCLGLVSVTLTFGHSMWMAFRGADNDLAGRQADQAIEGAARYALFLLSNLEERGQLPLDQSYYAEQVPVGDAWFWFLARPEEQDRLNRPVFGLMDEAGKLNLNTATREMLEMLPGMTPELAASIVQWRSEDEEGIEGGAGSSTYLLRQPPHLCKNAPFESVEELALVHGATWEILYGDDLNRNGVWDPHERSGGQFELGLIAHLTVHSREPNLRSDGSARINVNQPSEALGELLREAFGQTRGAEIQAGLGGGTSQHGSLLAFFMRSGMSIEEFDQVAGDLTVSDEEFLVGLVNVNTASETVLACIPGIDEAKASELVATRLGRAAPARSVAWVAEVLGEENATLAGPHLTAQSWQAMADVAAVGRHGRGYRRMQIVIDVSGDAPGIVYRRNLAPLGWALGQETQQTLAMERSLR